MNNPVSATNASLKAGIRIRPDFDLKSRVQKVIDLERDIRKFDPAYEVSPFFDKIPDYFNAPTNNDAVVPEKEGLGWQIVKVLDSYNKSVDKTTEFIEMLANKIEIAGFQLGPILSLMGFLPGSSNQQDQFAQYFKALMNAINQAHAATVQTDLHLLMESIETSIAKATSAAQGATSWAKQGKPAFDTYFAQYDADSREAVNEMLQDSRWRRVFDLSVYTQWDSGEYMPWSAYMCAKKGKLWDQKHALEEIVNDVPKESGGLVWDYQLAIPALFCAINARLVVLKTFYPEYNKVSRIYRDEIYTWINFLTNQVMPRFKKAIVKEDPRMWYDLSYTSIHRSHFCWNMYSGEFVTGDRVKDTQFIQGRSFEDKSVQTFMMNRYYSLYTPMVTGV